MLEDENVWNRRSVSALFKGIAILYPMKMERALTAFR